MIYVRYGCGCNQTFDKKVPPFCHQHGDSLQRVEKVVPRAPTAPPAAPPPKKEGKGTPKKPRTVKGKK